MSEANPICVALDTPDLDRARVLAKALKPHVGYMKIGMEFFYAHGAKGYEAVAAEGLPIFLDLKLHDIPATVRAAIAAATKPRVRFLTVHCEQADQLVGAGPRDAHPQLLGVTALTSMGRAEMTATGWYASDLTVEDLVLRRAAVARDAGCAGVVCSGNEVRAIKQRFGRELLVVTPGIRPTWAAVSGDDQRRATTPAEAISAGADFIVVGRPIRAASDPAEAADRMVDEIADVLDRMH